MNSNLQGFRSFVSILVVLGSLSIHSVGAQQKKKQVSKEAGSDSDPAILDFEGDVIEGQRKKPDLFMQTGSQNLTLDAILFLRNDFNDLHQVQQNRKPGFFEKRSR